MKLKMHVKIHDESFVEKDAKQCIRLYRQQPENRARVGKFYD
jgi:hypothetical protein